MARDTNIRHYIFGIILFTFFIVGGVAFILELATSNPAMIDDDRFTQFNSSFNKMELLQGKVDDIETNINQTEPGDSPLNNLITGSWQTLRLIGSTFSFMDDIFIATYTIFGIPKWISQIVMMLITALLAFVIYGLIFQRDT